ncbi:MAG: DEAD/DEAH box helicase family protein [bacterium]
MSFKDLNLKKTYSSDLDNVLFDFYIPVLNEAIVYNRLAGFFTSNSLAISAKGLADFIKNDGKMKMIISPKLTQEDKEILLISQKKLQSKIKDKFLNEIENINQKIIKEPVKALGWMIANERLKIKVMLVYDKSGKLLSADEIEEKGIFHQKVGILHDKKGNILSFSGSINETAKAWLDNIEEFKVFKSWKKVQKEYLREDINKFERFWKGSSQNIGTMDLPDKIIEKFIDIAPENIDQINWDLFYKHSSGKNQDKKNQIELFEHQKDAIEKWFDNNMNGLFEMATGTGKTYAALGCYKELNSQKMNLGTVITAPTNHLIQQWEQEIIKFGINADRMFCDSSNNSWRTDLYNNLADLLMGYIENLIVFTTHRTFSKDDFTNIIKKFEKDLDLFLIADEVHGVGANRTQLGLIEDYQYRLGLSATPKRWLDFEGTEKIYDYFGGRVKKFDLKDAIYETNPKTGMSYLTPYKYFAKFTELTNREIYDYKKLTKKIVVNYNLNKENERADFLERLLYERANIVKEAENKFDMLKGILDDLGNDLKGTIIYCTTNQIDRVMNILRDRKISRHKFTMEEDPNPSPKFNGISERQYLLNLFSQGKYQVLAAMHCLDEGVDIPPAKRAILLASSGNPREYIQRIGRVLRRHQKKSLAYIYDIIIRPGLFFNKSIFNIEKKIFLKELKRSKELARIASNKVEAINKIEDEITRIRRLSK